NCWRDLEEGHVGERFEHLLLRDVHGGGHRCLQLLDRTSLRRGSGAHAHHSHSTGTHILGEIPREIFDCAKCCAACRGARRVRAGLPVTNRITPERCSSMCRAAARDVMNCDLTSVTNGAMNSSTLSCVAGLPPPYSVSRGPIRLNTISMLPAWLAIPSMYAST